MGFLFCPVGSRSNPHGKGGFKSEVAQMQSSISNTHCKDGFQWGVGECKCLLPTNLLKHFPKATQLETALQEEFPRQVPTAPLPSPAFQPLPSVYNSILRDYILTFLLHRRGLLGSFTFQGNFWGQAKLPPLLLLPTIHCLLLCSVLWRFILQISVHASSLKQPAFLLPPKKKFCLPSGSQS